MIFAFATEILNAKTSDLIAFHNANVPEDKRVKKFSDRGAAIKRCVKIFNELKKPEPKKPMDAIRAAMSEAQKASWCDSEVRAARCERSAVIVDGIEYKSLAVAFRELGIPTGRFHSFRIKLKEQGRLTEYGREWTIIPLNY